MRAAKNDVKEYPERNPTNYQETADSGRIGQTEQKPPRASKTEPLSQLERAAFPSRQLSERAGSTGMKKSTEVAKRPFRGPFRVHGFSLLVQVGHRNEQGEDGCRKGVPVSGFDSRIALGGQKVGRIHYTSTEECQLPHTCHTKALGQG